MDNVVRGFSLIQYCISRLFMIKYIRIQRKDVLCMIHKGTITLVTQRLILRQAVEAGAERIIIPEENWEERFRALPVRVFPVNDIAAVMRIAFDIPEETSLESGVVPLGALRLAIGD